MQDSPHKCFTSLGLAIIYQPPTSSAAFSVQRRFLRRHYSSHKVTGSGLTAGSVTQPSLPAGMSSSVPYHSGSCSSHDEARLLTALVGSRIAPAPAQQALSSPSRRLSSAQAAKVEPVRSPVSAPLHARLLSFVLCARTGLSSLLRSVIKCATRTVLGRSQRTIDILVP